jgi:hypothetical protein
MRQSDLDAVTSSDEDYKPLAITPDASTDDSTPEPASTDEVSSDDSSEPANTKASANIDNYKSDDNDTVALTAKRQKLSLARSALYRKVREALNTYKRLSEKDLKDLAKEGTGELPERIQVIYDAYLLL